MKTIKQPAITLGRWLAILWLCASSPALYAQGPTVDPNFLPSLVAVNGYARQVVQQPNGQRVLFGAFAQAAGSSFPNGLVRLLAGSNQLDPVFQANTAGLSTVSVERIIGLPNNQLLVFSRDNAQLTLGTVSQRGLLRLNADGTPDASFDMGTGPGIGVEDVVVQPDGKLLLVGTFTQFNGQPVRPLVRLNPNGSLDATFQSALTGPNTFLYRVALQPDGKMLVAGSFAAVAGQPTGLLARLLPSGAFDTGFTAPALLSGLYVAGMAVQPDGGIVVAFGRDQGLGTGFQPLMRLLANGSFDPSFQTGSNFNDWFFGPGLPPQPVSVEAGGNIIVTTTATAYNGQAIGRVVRLLPGGSLDTGFQTLAISGALYPAAPTSLQLLANGQYLTNYKLLNTDGGVDASFDPQLKNPGQVLALARQPDGKLLVGGLFSEIAGIAAGSLARLNADGTPDVAFTTFATTNGIVYDLAVQPDGKVLVGGDFSLLGGSARVALGRLMPNGQADVGFAPTIQPQAAGQAPPIVRALAMQADGNVLLAGSFIFVPGGGANSRRTAARVLGGTGQLDASFSDFYAFNVNQFLVQPDGTIVLAGQGRFSSQGPTVLVQRILPDGNLDPAFTVTSSTGLLEIGRSVQRDATGRLYLGGRFAQFGGVASSNVVRLLPNGTPDPSFTASLAGNSSSDVYAVALQPNGRILAGGAILPGTGRAFGTVRLLTNGSLDASYDPLAGPDRPVFRLLVQPDGAIVAGGAFTFAGSLSRVALTRLLDANVLAVSSPQLHANTIAWPVPTHGVLHLSFDATAQPQQVVLLNNLGQTVHRQSIAVNTANVSLALDGIVPGVYMLRTQYAAGGWVSQRILID